MEEQNKQSEFNEASLKMQRLHHAQEYANFHQINGDKNKWLICLCDIFKEICGKCLTEEKLEIRKKINKISIRLHQSSINSDMASHPPFLTLPNKDGSFRNTESALFDLDCRLRELIDSHGYGSPTKANPKGAMLG